MPTRKTWDYSVRNIKTYFFHFFLQNQLYNQYSANKALPPALQAPHNFMILPLLEGFRGGNAAGVPTSVQGPPPHLTPCAPPSGVLPPLSPPQENNNQAVSVSYNISDFVYDTE